MFHHDAYATAARARRRAVARATVRLLVGLAPVLMVLLFGAACGSSAGAPDGDPRALAALSQGVTLRSIAVTPTPSSLYAGVTEALTAVGTYSDKSTQNLTATAIWTSSNTQVATVSSAGVVTTLSAGSAQITATSGTVKGHATVKVLVTLTSIAVTPPAATLPANVTETLDATGSYDNKTTKTLTTTVAWASSNTAIATVSSAGVVATVAPGTATITASTGAGAASTVTGSATITVDAATMTSIAVTPPKKSLPLATTQKMTAKAHFSDGTLYTLVAPVVTWSSSTPSVASVSTAGVVTAVALGTATVTATSPSGVTGSAAFTVTAATLKSVAIAPAAPSIVAGETQQFSATGTYSDGSTQDITQTATWSSSPASVATISNAAGSQGLATGVSAGATTITAMDPKTKKKGTTTLTVTSVVLVSVMVTGQTGSLVLGESEQLLATGTYSDGSQADLTDSATWASSTVAVTESNTSGSQGQATAANLGAAVVTATDPTTGVQGSFTITVGSQAVLGCRAALFAAPQIYSATTQALEPVTADFNGDGHPDLAVADQFGTVSVYFGSANGSMTAQPHLYTSAGSSWGIAAADLNGDGALDLAVADGVSLVDVFLGTGGGAFASTPILAAAGGGPLPVAIADMNGDTIPDLVTGLWADGEVSVLLGVGEATSPRPPCMR